MNMEMFCIGALAGMIFTIIFIITVKVANHDTYDNCNISSHSDINNKSDGLDTGDNSKFKNAEELDQLIDDLYTLKMTGGFSTTEKDIITNAIDVIDLYIVKLSGEN